MWTDQDEPALDDLFEIIKLKDKDWLEKTLQQRWHRLKASVSSPGIYRPLKTKRSSTDEGNPGDYFGAFASSQQLPASLGPHDLTASQLSSSRAISSHVAYIRAFDWGSTGLGQMHSWPPELRRTVNFLLADPRAAVLYWGPSRIAIYNAPYTQVLADKHPSALGKTAEQIWPGHNEREIGRAIAKANETGDSSCGNSDAFFVHRRGFLEELYGDWSVIPITGGTGNLGYYNTVVDLTEQEHNKRQMDTLLKLERQTAEVKNVDEFWPSIIDGLEHNLHEAPFAVVYSAAAKPSSSRTSSIHSFGVSDTADHLQASRFWNLEGALGLQNNQVFPARIDSDWASANITSAFKDCITTGKTQYIQLKPTSPLYGVAKSRAYGDQCSSAKLIPIGRAHDGDNIGFLLLGIHSRRMYDLNYKQFVRMLSKQLSSTLNAVRQFEDDARRANLQAELVALDRSLLSEKLALTQKEAQDNERRFKTLAGHLPIAMYELSPSGDMMYANEEYFKLSGLDPENLYPYCWVDTIHPDDNEVYQANWERLTAGEAVRFESRLRMPWAAGDVLRGEEVKGETWVLSAAFAHKNNDGTLRSIQGALIDISRQKWMEKYQEQRYEEAIELKRQQEHFMDFVGHEIRNPLSATSLCATSILTTLEELLHNTTLDDPTDLVTVDRNTVQSQMENAEIITACITYQQRIIDDILTLSKLDSGLLVICPCETRPIDLLQQSIRLFDAEVHQADVQLSCVIDDSYYNMGIDWALLDPARLQQILLNLITNAIKFTKAEDKRMITVTLAASEERPSNSLSGAEYLVQPNGLHKDIEETQHHEDTVFLMFAVKDTGCGMKEHELQRIFKKFGQSSHKTHIDYGGSGLGLFISRELSRLQGGQISVTSQHQVGSTFEFYVQTTRCAPPELVRRRSSYANIHTRRNNKSSSAASVSHILLVEDNLVNQKVMEKQLRLAGFEIHVANHGAEALDFISRSTFTNPSSPLTIDVVLMDLEMPIMGGLEATANIREMEREGRVLGGRHVPIVGVTANARAEQQTQALEAGMDAVVTKPFRMEELLEKVEGTFGGWAEVPER